MPRYSEERKNALLGKLMPPDNQPVPVVANLNISPAGEKKRGINQNSV